MARADQASASSSPGGEVSGREAQPGRALADAHGLIPEIPPRAEDEQGRLIPLTADERSARSVAVLRTLAALRGLADDDPPDTLERLMKGLDEHRAPDRRLFEGLS